MLKRSLLYVVVLIILLGLFYAAGQWDKDTALLGQFGDEISVYLDGEGKKAETWAAAHSGPLSLKDAQDADLQDFTIIWHERDSILQWSNTKTLPSPLELRKMAALSGKFYMRLAAGDFLVQRSQGRSIFLPIKYALGARGSEHGKTAFPANRNISPDVQVSTEKTDYPVVADGKAICYLSSDAPVHWAMLQWIKLLAFLLFLGVFLYFIAQIAVVLSQKTGWGASVALVFATVLSLVWANHATGFTQSQFGGLPIFSSIGDSAPAWVGSSLGDWLLHVVLWIWGIFFLHRAWPKATVAVPMEEDLLLLGDQAPQPPAQPVKLGLPKAVLACFLGMLAVWAGAKAIGHLVAQGTQAYDFNGLLGGGLKGGMALLGLVLLMVGMFLWSHRMALFVKDLGLARTQRFAALGVAAVLFAGLSFTTLDAGTALLAVIFGVVTAFLFDLYVQWEDGDFSWLLCWLLLYALFTAVQLHQHNTAEDARLRLRFASALAEARDVDFAEKDLPVFYAALLRDSVALENGLKPWPFKANSGDIAALVNNTLIRYGYLFRNYRAHASAFDQEAAPLLLNQRLSVEETRDFWDKAKAVDAAGVVRGGTDSQGILRYLMRLSLHRMGDQTQPVTLWIALDQTYPAVSKVFDQAFYGQDFKNMPQLSRYDYALRRAGRMIVEQGRNLSPTLATALDNGQSKDIENEQLGRRDAVAKSADGASTAAVGRQNGGWAKAVYLFSILFALTSILLFGLAFLNAFVHFLPDAYVFSLSAKGSLAKRIHASNVSLLAISFVVVGYLTYQHFTGTARENEIAKADFQADALFANLRARLLNVKNTEDSTGNGLYTALEGMANSLSTDAMFYDANGHLRWSSKDNLVRSGLLPNVLNRLALSELREAGLPETQVREQANGLTYDAKYMALRDAQNHLVGYLGLPFQQTGRKIGAEVSNFIGMLASLYVFLLLVAFAVTYLLARSIIRPLSLLAEKVKKLKLEDKNEPLQYGGDAKDEVSDLIVQYNGMVDKLEASKLQMVRLEREGAWREMARQVAHDIKNPLTTMKLSMQQLERVSNNPEQAAAYLRKAITRLIEQIDSLAQIASEFSMFANLDIRNKSDVVINEVVENVHYLFSEQKNVDLNLTLPSEKLHIMGDKNHLIRVFNNLIINAIQAIPSDRLGKIKVSLSRDGELAVLRISDNGGGIPPEIRDRVFEPNFTTKTSGSGLGLAICKKIIEAHDGDIRFETRDNEGTDFFVEIPVVSVGLQMKFP
jgi:two-component system, NtrC family, nitrogen regulation sensor histidine kinase NtrY